MSLKNNYTVRLISNGLALKVAVEKHYLHRRTLCAQSFGLYTVKDDLVGIVIYGNPPGNRVAASICGEDERKNVYELTRLWVDDSVPKNGESYLIGNSLKLIDREIVISYADIGYNHLGVVYQATNFLYTGLSSPITHYSIDGDDSFHKRNIAIHYGSMKKAREILGDRLQCYPGPRKHRYVYFNADKRRKVELRDKLRYDVLPYPKRAI